MKHMKRLVSAVLALILALGVMIPAGAAGKEAVAPQAAPPAWAVDDHPVIIIHGIGQSEVFLYDEATGEKVIGADGEPVQGWPPKIEINGLIPKLIFPLLASLLLQCDIFLTKTVRGLAKDILSVFLMDDEGRPAQNMKVEKLHRYNGDDKPPTSMADLSQAGKDMAYGHIPLQEMADVIGEKNMYYFAYDSFGNLSDIVDDLYTTIQDILKKHSQPGKPCTKVNVIPISLGGTIMNGLVEYYKDKGIMSQLNNVVYVIAALDGSALVGDLYTRRLATDNESLYRKLIPSLVEGYLGYLLNIVLRLLPKRLVKSILDAVIDGAVGDVVGYSTMIWALLPGKDYAAASAEWLSDPKMAKIKAQTDKYRAAQANSRANVRAMKTAGVRCYAIAEYNWPLYGFVASAKTENSDILLQLDSPSMGATYGFVDTPLPQAYRDAADPKYLSPDGIVDASTGTLPDHTWYFKDQNHERTGRCDVIMKLTLRLSCGANAESVTSMLPEWPQFNYGRDGRWLKNDALRAAANVKTAELSAEDRQEFLEALAEVEAQERATVVDPVKYQQVRDRFTAIMIKIGAWNAPKQPSFWERAGEKVSWFFSEALYFGYGPRGFADPLWTIWTR